MVGAYVTSFDQGPSWPHPDIVTESGRKPSHTNTITDTATYDDPKQEPAGVAWVLVNGEITYDHGRHTGARPGRLLHYRQS